MTETHKLDLGAVDQAIVLNILAKRIPERDVYVFGSRVNGLSRHRSDLDLAVEGSLTLRQRAELRDDFTESDLPISVDVVEIAMMTPIFKKRAEQEWVLLARGDKTNQDRVAA